MRKANKNVGKENIRAMAKLKTGMFIDQIATTYCDGYDKGFDDGARCQDEVQYQHGFEDAWDMLKNICLGGRERLLRVFGTISITQIITDNTASEAKAKIDAWGQKQKVKKNCPECKYSDNRDVDRCYDCEKGYADGFERDEDVIIVGDEVIWDDVKYTVTAIADDGDVSLIDENGESTWTLVNQCDKTGRHFDGIAEVLKQMQE